MIKADNKFEIGEITSIKGVGQRFLICEIVTITCTAGTQIIYHGCILFPKETYQSKDSKTYYLDKDMKFNEVILEKIEPVKKKDIKIDDNLKSLVDKMLKARENKEKFIKEQDFEKAAKNRDDEKHIKDLLEKLYDITDVKEVLELMNIETNLNKKED